MTIGELKTAIALAQTLDMLPDETEVVVEVLGHPVAVDSAGSKPDDGGCHWLLVLVPRA